MKTSLFRSITLGVICASCVGMCATASAFGPREDRIRSKISHLQAAKSNALAHHNRGKARAIQGKIDSLQAQLHHHHH